MIINLCKKTTKEPACTPHRKILTFRGKAIIHEADTYIRQPRNQATPKLWR